ITVEILRNNLCQHQVNCRLQQQKLLLESLQDGNFWSFGCPETLPGLSCCSQHGLVVPGECHT
ncbi:unnamed protein product, partial [Candidula unifasciata]